MIGETDIEQLAWKAPCPFCGEPARLAVWTQYAILHGTSQTATPAYDYHYVGCGSCLGRGPEGKTALRAIELWNTRKETAYDVEA